MSTRTATATPSTAWEELTASRTAQVGSLYAKEYQLGPYTRLTAYFDLSRKRLSVSGGSVREAVALDSEGLRYFDSPYPEGLTFTFEGESYSLFLCDDDIVLGVAR